MASLSPHILKELGKTLAPAYGPETPSEAVNRLVGFYQRLPEDERFAFVVALIGDVVTERAVARQRQKVLGGTA